MVIACLVVTVFVLFARGYSACATTTQIWCTANLDNSPICWFRKFKVCIVMLLFVKKYFYDISKFVDI